MTQRIPRLLIILAAIAVPAWAQRNGPYTLITNNTCTTAIAIARGANATVAIDITGGFTGTLQPQVLMTGQTARNTIVIPSTSQTTQSTITAAGGFTAIQVAGFDSFQLCVSGGDLTGAAATIYLTPSTAPVSQLGGGGGGSGTVTSVSVTTANGVSGTVATATTTPAISLALGAVTPSSVAISDTAANADLTETNSTTGTVSTTNASPLLEFISNSYNGASVPDIFSIGQSCVAGSNPICLLSFAHPSGTTGNVQFVFPAPAQNTNPSIAGPGVTTAGITVGATTGFPLKVIVPSSNRAHAIAISAWRDGYAAGRHVQ